MPNIYAFDSVEYFAKVDAGQVESGGDTSGHRSSYISVSEMERGCLKGKGEALTAKPCCPWGKARLRS